MTLRSRRWHRLSTVLFVFASTVAVGVSSFGQPAPAAPALPAASAAPSSGTPLGSASAAPLPTVVPPLPASAAPAPKVDEVRVALTPVAGGLTADSVAERAVVSSATVQQKLAELDVARAKVDQTTIRFYPHLTLSASYMRLSPVSGSFGDGASVGAANAGLLSVGACPGGGAGQCVLDSQGSPVGAAAFSLVFPENNYTLTAQLSVPFSDYLLSLSDAAAGSAASIEASKLQVKAERLNVQSSARALYYDWLRARARVVIAQKSLERTRARLGEARDALELGSITKADLLRLEALVASTEQVLLEAKSFSATAQNQLAIVMGDKPGVEYQLGEDISAPHDEVQGTIEQLTERALSSRLELRALESAQRSMRYAASVSRSGVYPRLDGIAEATYANPNQRNFPPAEEWNPSWAVGARLTFGLSDALGASASGREFEATARSLDAQKRVLVDGIRQEVMSYVLARERAKGALDSARRGLVASEEAYRVATDLYQLGRTTTSDVIDAEADLLGARLAELNARIEIHIVEARLRHAAGFDVSE
jgi:outer membrane protein TolC